MQPSRRSAAPLRCDHVSCASVRRLMLGVYHRTGSYLFLSVDPLCDHVCVVLEAKLRMRVL